MYGEDVNVGMIRIFILCTPSYSDEQKMKKAKMLLLKWAKAGFPDNADISINFH